MLGAAQLRCDNPAIAKRWENAVSNAEDAQILFESDMTCCRCRERGDKPLHIHHIDENHSNDDRDNKAVLCANCHHGQAHGQALFGRRLSPDVLRLYDRSWRDICKRRLNPDPEAPSLTEYQSEALLQVTLVCHAWKNTFMNSCGPVKAQPGAEYQDVWDLLIHFVRRESSEGERLDQLLTTVCDMTVNDLEQIMACHGHVLPGQIMTQIIRTNRQLNTEQVVHRVMKGKSMPDGEPYTPNLEGVLGSLMTLARMADKLRSTPQDQAMAKARESPPAV